MAKTIDQFQTTFNKLYIVFNQIVFHSRSSIDVYRHITELVCIVSTLVRLEHPVHYQFGDRAIESECVGARSGSESVRVAVKCCHGSSTHTAGTS